ncbi:site-specific integrase [Pedobacter sp. PF22-3]|uniref:site-specific integrase n=1 Tax=Pedobacter sp. PF22-3 TaxID=2994467 RepID=UPI002247195A|nr:site-specific integrase [Pedobacter sp. PF22-3]MCX2495271.1 site-specific integrase [Pedobacter sp. PF22-3]
MSVIKVVLRNKPKADGTRPLAIRIYKDGKESYIYLGYYLDPEHWDAKAQRVKKPHSNITRFNNLIAQRVAEAMEKVLEVDASVENASASLMKQKVKPTGGQKFYAQADLYLETLKEAGKFNRYTADKSKSQHFKDFVGHDLPFSEVTVALLERFKHYLMTKLEVSERTAINHWVFVRSIFSQAIKNGVADAKHYPFGRGKIVIKFPETKKVGLSIEDIQKLEQLELKYPVQNHVRNLWLFSFYMGGMRGSDILRLRWSDFENGRLYYTMGKNSKTVNFKVPEKAMIILENYKSNRTNFDDLIFPELKDLKNLDDTFEVQRKIMNAICRLDKILTKKVAAKAKITAKITMHIARHSFGRIAGDTIALTTAQKLFRHSDITTTMGYMNNFIHKDEDEALDAVVNFKNSANDNGRVKQAKRLRAM